MSQPSVPASVLIGRVSGDIPTALKHFFDTAYHRILDHVAGRPYGLWVHGNNDAAGVDAAVRERGYGLGGTLAATLMN